MTAQRQIGQGVQVRDTRSGMGHAMWISGRIETLLSHYYQPDNPAEVRDGALDDWVEILAPLSQKVIEHACSSWLRDEPRRRPTPGDIRARARDHAASPQNAQGDRSKLSFDELVLLDEKVLPTARRWLGIPGLRQHAEQTLSYWGETFDPARRDR